jgi:hypothetical protein
MVGPVRFIAITDENQQVVEHFLKQTPIHSWVGLAGAGRSNLVDGVGSAYHIHILHAVLRKEGAVMRDRPCSLAALQS